MAEEPSRRRPGGQAAQRAFRARVARHRADVAALGRHTRLVVVFAAVTGALTGLGVAGFESVTRAGLFDHLRRGPVAVQIGAPLAGLILAAVALRYAAGGATPATADEYIHNFHQAGVRLGLRAVPGRLLASVATLGLGGAMGYEGPSIYLGGNCSGAARAERAIIHH